MQRDAKDVIQTSLGELTCRDCHVYDEAIVGSRDGSGQLIYTHGFLTLELNDDADAVVLVNVESYERNFDGGWLGHCDDGEYGAPDERATQAAFEVEAALIAHFSDCVKAWLPNGRGGPEK